MPTCHPVTLARNGIAHVQRCTGGDCVSIHLGPTTPCIDAAGLDARRAVPGEAASTLHARRTTPLLDAQNGLA